MKKETCCFTGHRDIPAQEEAAVRSRLRKQILDLLEKGCNTFLVGGARGFDMLAAEVLLDLREKEGKDLRLFSALPFPEWREFWPDENFAREERILKASDHVSFSKEKINRRAYLDRDRKMVDESSLCIAWCTRRSGGTAYTIRYALKNGIQVINLADWDIRKLMDGVGKKA